MYCIIILQLFSFIYSFRAIVLLFINFNEVSKCLNYSKFFHIILFFIFQLSFNNSHWNSLKLLTNPDLRKLASSLPSVVSASKSENTVKKYKGYFKRFKDWCLNYRLSFLPASVCTVAIYLNYLIQLEVSTSVLNAAYYSIAAKIYCPLRQFSLIFHTFSYKHVAVELTSLTMASPLLAVLAIKYVCV